LRDIENDALTIMMNATRQGVAAGSNRLSTQHQKLLNNTVTNDTVEDAEDESE
jgi:hypothetical protein